MPRMTNSNAREMLSSTLKQFRSITGESIGVVHTWRGKLASIGPEKFQNLVHSLKDEVSKSIVGKHIEPVHDRLSDDQRVIDLIWGDLDTINVPTLRRLVSWITKDSIGKNMAFWKDDSLKPSFWPDDVEYKNIKLCKRESLCKIIQCYKASRNLDNVREQSPKTIPHATTKRRRTSSETLSNKRPRLSSETRNEDTHPQCSSTVALPVSDIDTSSNGSFFPGFKQQIENSSNTDPIFPGPTPSLATLLGTTPLSPIFEFTPIINKKDKAQSLHELSTPNTFLTDTCINAFCDLLKNTYPHVQGLQDTILSRNRQFIRAPRPSMQIHHDGALHWVCSSVDIEGNVSLYDSMMTGRTSEELDIQLSLLYGSSSGELHVTFVPIQQQRGGADCGLFAAAVCLAVANGDDPTLVRWKQNRMRTHLSSCFNNELLTPFPTTESKILRSKMSTYSISEFKIKLWCLCNLPSYAFANMVECPKCLNWYHKPCVGFVDVSEDVEFFSCPPCSHRNATSLTE